MATTTLKGIVKEVKPIEFYGEGNKGRRQTVVLFVPGYVNQYKEKLSQDEIWGIDLFNKKIDDFGLNSNCLSKKAEVEVYLSGKEFDKKDGSGKMYAISARLKSIKLGEQVNYQMESSNEEPEDDDLPF